MKIFSGSVNSKLAAGIAGFLNIQLSSIKTSKFSDGEIFVKILENTRGGDVFLIQSTIPPADNIMEMLLMIDALRRASAGRITAVIPYYGYSRQDKKDEPRVPISAKLLANLIVKAGADRILTLDLHSQQIAGYFDIPVDHLFAAPVTIKHMKLCGIPDENLVFVSPDVGRVFVTRAIAKRLDSNIPIAIIDKRRPAPNEAEVVNIIGDISGKLAVIIDDIVDTAGTLTKAADALKEAGARDVLAYITHPILSGNSLSRIDSSALSKLIVTDTIPLGDKQSEKIEVISVAELLGEAILRIHENKSVSSLFV
ncbi:ribose-phosphate pyrophosphokinase [candidate division WOR-3 bacterium]|nr:ribose-phosphate pyrophosphokinase [candidate division WOR-3 bacterium]MCK4528167.1 ribose-phosphate pyrophosphokinase [candidate division WOR-3 bacterium]